MNLRSSWSAKVVLAVSVLNTGAAEGMSVRGVVREAGSLQPVAEVRVVLSRPVQVQPRVRVGGATDLAETRTDVNGEFSFEVESAGDYRVRAEKAGYAASAGFAASVDVKLSEEAPTAQADFVLAGTGEIHGRVVDAETDKPVGGLRVVVAERRWVRGRGVALPAKSGVTDAEGQFAVKGLQSGSYVFQFLPRFRTPLQGREDAVPGSELRVLSKFTSGDAEAVSWEYETGWWPGASEMRDAIPISVIVGSAVDAGDIVLRRVPAYTAKVRVGGDCTPGEIFQVNAAAVSPSWALGGIGSFPCGSEILLRGLTRGDYRLDLISEKRPRANRTRAVVRFSVTDRPIEVVAPIERGVDIAGRFVVPQGVALPDVRGVRISLAPADFAPFLDETVNPIDADGKFALINTEVRLERLRLSALPESYYVRAIRYNGVVLPGPMLAVDQRAVEQRLEIEIDNRPAGVAGRVVEGDRGVADAYVVLLRWPVNWADAYDLLAGAVTAKDGSFRIGPAPEGEYRVVAVPGKLRDKIEEPGSLERLMGKTEKVTVGLGRYESVTLKVTADW